MAQALKRKNTALKAYLVLFNVASFLGWGCILVLTLNHILNLDGTEATPNTASSILSRFLSTSLPKALKPFAAESRIPPYLQPIFYRSTTTFWRVGTLTAFVQSLAILEVVHVLLGWVRSPVPTTAAQVASRLFLVWGISEQFPNVQGNPLYTSMVLAWSMTEVIRYPFYALNLLGSNPYPLLYLRYTTFWVLYPVGASSEAFLIYATLPPSSPIPGIGSHLQGLWKASDYARAGLFGIWWPGLYILYTHMISQRRRVLGGVPDKKTN